MSVEITLTHGKRAIVDNTDAFRVSMYDWQAYPHRSGNWYATRSRPPRKMHAFVLGITDTTKDIHHINGNGLDNRKCNLTVVTKQEHTCYRKRNKNNSTGFKGVYYKKQQCQFVAQVNYKGKRLHLGYFITARAAAKVYNDFVQAHINKDYSVTKL